MNSNLQTRGPWISVVTVAVVLTVAPSLLAAEDIDQSTDEELLEIGQNPESDDTEAELARAAQNPIASMISLPLQNNMNFNVGPQDGIQNVLNIQPVIPFSITPKLNLITRTIVPVLSQPEFVAGQGRTSGLSDTVFTAFFSRINGCHELEVPSYFRILTVDFFDSGTGFCPGSDDSIART